MSLSDAVHTVQLIHEIVVSDASNRKLYGALFFLSSSELTWLDCSTDDVDCQVASFATWLDCLTDDVDCQVASFCTNQSQEYFLLTWRFISFWICFQN